MNDVCLRAGNDIHIILSDVRDMRGQHLGSEEADMFEVLHWSLVPVSLGYGLRFSQMLSKVEVHGDIARAGLFFRLVQNIFGDGVWGMRRQMDAQSVAELTMVLVIQLQTSSEADGSVTRIVDHDLAFFDIADRSDVSRIRQSQVRAKAKPLHQLQPNVGASEILLNDHRCASEQHGDCVPLHDGGELVVAELGVGEAEYGNEAVIKRSRVMHADLQIRHARAAYSLRACAN